MPQINLRLSELKRQRITKKQKAEIKAMYKDLAKTAKAHRKQLEGVGTGTAFLQRQRLDDMVQALSVESKLISGSLETKILNNMTVMSQTTVTDMNQFLTKANLNIKGAYAHVPTEVVQSIYSGKIYEGNWSLSQAIWGNDQKILDDIQKIVAKGTAENLSAYDIAKDLERYVNPSARKDWKWSKVYPGTNKVVDYNAQRLARTMVSHAYQQSVIQTAKDNPYIDGIKWLSSGTERMCDLCAERDGKIYSPEDIPLDHPNGMCSYAPVITKSFQQISDELANNRLEELNNPEFQKWKNSMRGKST